MSKRTIVGIHIKLAVKFDKMRQEIAAAVISRCHHLHISNVLSSPKPQTDQKEAFVSRFGADERRKVSDVLVIVARALLISYVGQPIIEDVFMEVSQLIQSALDGCKVCTFAYGQIGFGKTYTMMGEPGQDGLIPRALRKIFDARSILETQGWKCEVDVSILETYNETIRDLIAPNKLAAYSIQYDNSVPGFAIENVDSSKSAFDLLRRATNNR
ncbi:kinesin 2 [Perilla frutescens var. frutescens]|nr:kinesin 2 [Perilla frutescens var. frutescens]